MPQNPSGPVKFSDVVANYKAGHPDRQVEKDIDPSHPGKEMEEQEDYLFERWAWYWHNHLDSNGYMVSPVKTVNEWRRYEMTHAGSANRTMDSTSNCNWTFQGPDSSAGGYNGVGRINIVRFDPVDSNTFYVGTAGGGLWKTANGGANWTPLYSDLPSAGVSDLCINPNNTSSIFVCTGDGDGTDDYSIGIIHSTDGGLTWNNTGLVWNESSMVTANSICMNVQDTNTLICATSIGIYVTHNGGASWRNVASGNFKQVIYNPSDTTVVYATTYASSTSAQIYTSTNGGMTWAPVTSFSDCIRITLAVCPAVPYEVVALAANYSYGFEGLYTSLNDGTSFTAVYQNDAACSKNLLGYELGLPTTQCNGQGWYDLALAVDPTNANNIIVGGINNYYSTNGGTSWQLVTEWYYDPSLFTVATVHADKHCLNYNPLNGALYETCDGGIYVTEDIASRNWTDITLGLGITEFYRNALTSTSTFCIGGAQDNGTKMINAGVYTDLAGGDGMQCQVDYGDPTNSTFYASNPNGYIQMTTDAGISFTPISTNIPDANGGDWVTPYIIHPVNDNILLVGYDTLFISYDYGATWAPISPNFHSGYNINNIAVPIVNDTFVYIADDYNTIHFSPNFGNVWHTIPITIPIGGQSITRLIMDPTNDSAIYVTFGGYGTSKVARYDMGTNRWTTFNAGLPDVPVNCIIIDTESLTKYIGTDVTVFYMDTTMTTWEPYNTNLPSVIVNDLNINYSTNEIWAATYGRSMWTTLKKDIPNGVSMIPYAADVISVSPNPSAGNFVVHTTNELLSGKNATVKIIALNGSTVYNTNGTFDISGSFSISAGNLLPGNYICEVENDKIVARCKITIKR